MSALGEKQTLVAGADMFAKRHQRTLVGKNRVTPASKQESAAPPQHRQSAY